jgi:hypothetical protein
MSGLLGGTEGDEDWSTDASRERLNWWKQTQPAKAKLWNDSIVFVLSFFFLSRRAVTQNDRFRQRKLIMKLLLFFLFINTGRPSISRFETPDVHLLKTHPILKPETRLCFNINVTTLSAPMLFLIKLMLTCPRSRFCLHWAKKHPLPTCIDWSSAAGFSEVRGGYEGPALQMYTLWGRLRIATTTTHPGMWRGREVRGWDG